MPESPRLGPQRGALGRLKLSRGGSASRAPRASPAPRMLVVMQRISSWLKRRPPHATGDNFGTGTRLDDREGEAAAQGVLDAGAGRPRRPDGQRGALTEGGHSSAPRPSCAVRGLPSGFLRGGGSARFAQRPAACREPGSDSRAVSASLPSPWRCAVAVGRALSLSS
jgi:hypothetical protein